MKVVIDGIACEAEYGEYILQVAKRNGIEIPTLCHSDGLPGLGSCRLCMVEVREGKKSGVVASCIYPITGEIEVTTDSERIAGMRRTITGLLLARVPENEYLKGLAAKYGAYPIRTMPALQAKDDCILCGLCVKACEAMGKSAISTVGRGIEKKVSTPYDEPSNDCIGCGSCAAACPTGAVKLEQHDGIRTIWGKNFELVKCRRCGSYYEPKEFIDYIRNRLGKSEDEEYCSTCRRIIEGEKFKDIYGI